MKNPNQLPVPLMDRVHDWTYERKIDGVTFNDATRRIAMQYRMKLRAAERFVIDNEAVKLCCHLSHEADQLDHWAILARLPYDVLWLEYNLHVKVQEYERMGTLRHPFDPTLVSPRMGVLLYRDRTDTPAWVAHQFYDYATRLVCPSPIAFLYDPEGEPHNPLKGSLTWRRPTLSLTPGFPPIPYAFDDGPRVSQGRVSPEAVLCGSIEAENNVVQARPWALHRTAAIIDPWWYAHLSMPDAAKMRLIATEVIEQAGALRWIVVLLATLNALPREITEVTPRRGKRQVSGSNMLPYFQHRTVRLQIPKHNQVVWARGHMASSASHGRNAPRPWHSVRGHWRLAKYKVGRGGTICQHEPQLVENGLAVCGKCEMLIRWVDSFHRGTNETGIVIHEYRVAAKKHGANDGQDSG